MTLYNVYKAIIEYPPENTVGKPIQMRADVVLVADAQAAIAEKDRKAQEAVDILQERIKELEAALMDKPDHSELDAAAFQINHLKAEKCLNGTYPERDCEHYKRQFDHMKTMVKGLEAELAEAREAYNDLILCVGNKYPGETRHDTAKRYILDREHFGMGAGAKQALKEVGK